MHIHRNLGIVASLIAVGSVLAVLCMSRPAQSMPNFAQTYGVQCTECHTQIPALNAYGRYVQRTGYAPLNPHVLRKQVAVWIDWPPTYSQQAPNTAVWQAGNVGLHADGAIANDWTYHVQQLLWQANGPGGLDTTSIRSMRKSPTWARVPTSTDTTIGRTIHEDAVLMNRLTSLLAGIIFAGIVLANFNSAVVGAPAPDGKAVFLLHCAACHQATGLGADRIRRLREIPMSTRSIVPD